MKKFHISKIAFLTFLILLIASPIKSSSDISRAFPDMSNVFDEVGFYDENNNITKFSGHENKVLLVFFGYTHCPDVCPTTVLDMARVMKNLGAQSSQVLPIFISVDYYRDDYKKVRYYVEYFDESIAAVNSNKENIDELKKFYKNKYDFVEPKNEGYIV